MKVAPIHIPKLKEVYMVVTIHGLGTEEDPIREVKYFYDKDTFKFIAMVDSFKN